MRKRTIILGIAALELAAIPALAVIGPPNFDFDRTHIITAEIESPPGIKRFFVSGNTAFSIVASDLTGPVVTFIQPQGNIGEVRFGGNTQLPGAVKTCAIASGRRSEIIFASERGIVTSDGPAISQAILITISHNPSQDPTIEFHKAHDKSGFILAKACGAKQKAIARK